MQHSTVRAAVRMLPQGEGGLRLHDENGLRRRPNQKPLSAAAQLVKQREVLALDWLVDSGASMNILPLSTYGGLGPLATPLRPVGACVRVANGHTVAVAGETTVTCKTKDGRILAITAWVIDGAPFALLSTRRLLHAGFEVSFKRNHAHMANAGGETMFNTCARSGMCYLQTLFTHTANAVTNARLHQELRKLKLEVRGMKTGEATNQQKEKKEWASGEELTHKRSGHARYDSRCESCVKARGVARRRPGGVAVTANFDYADISTSGDKAYVLVGSGPEGELFARAVPRKGSDQKDLREFVSMPKGRYGAALIARSDKEPALRTVVEKAARAEGVPYQPTTTETPQANGRAEQAVRSITERIQVLQEDWAHEGQPIEPSCPAFM